MKLHMLLLDKLQYIFISVSNIRFYSKNTNIEFINLSRVVSATRLKSICCSLPRRCSARSLTATLRYCSQFCHSEFCCLQFCLFLFFFSFCHFFILHFISLLFKLKVFFLLTSCLFHRGKPTGCNDQRTGTVASTKKLFAPSETSDQRTGSVPSSTKNSLSPQTILTETSLGLR